MVPQRKVPLFTNVDTQRQCEPVCSFTREIIHPNSAGREGELLSEAGKFFWQFSCQENIAGKCKIQNTFLSLKNRNKVTFGG